jgi:dihydroneopterin aldolase
MSSLTIGLDGMQFFAYHGCYPGEIEQGNWFEVHVSLQVPDNTASQTDQLTDTTDYSLIYRICREEMETRRNLLEKVSWEIGRRIMEEAKEILSIEIKVVKRNPPVAGEVKESWVRRVITRQSSGV